MLVWPANFRIESLISTDAQSDHIVVYLHGSGEFGCGATGQFQYPGLATLLNTNQLQPTYPIVHACALDHERYNLELLTQYFDFLKQRFDARHIHIVAYSRGGEAAYALAQGNYALSSVTIINAHVPDAPLTNLMAPVRIIQASKDKRVDVSRVKALAQEGMKNLEIEWVDGDHNAIESILKDSNFWAWINNI